jgi:hypothetical protein
MPKGACAEQSTPCPVTIKCAKRAIILPFLCNKARVVLSVIIGKDLISKCVSAIMTVVFLSDSRQGLRFKLAQALQKVNWGR